MVSRVVY